MGWKMVENKRNAVNDDFLMCLRRSMNYVINDGYSTMSNNEKMKDTLECERTMISDSFMLEDNLTEAIFYPSPLLSDIPNEQAE